MLTCVTLTGADDSVAPEQLVEISRRYPFVEWGILFGSHPGSERFPSIDWVNRLIEVVTGVGVKLSAHLCGRVLDNAMQDGFPKECGSAFDRCQLNFHANPVSESCVHRLVSGIQSGNWTRTREIIVQLDNVNNHVLNALLEHGIRASGLYDCSHGTGMKPDRWPAPNQKWEVGYAGGLGPETINGDLQSIKEAAGHQRFWIDMETKVRSFHRGMSRDQFDLSLCESVLQDLANEF